NMATLSTPDGLYVAFTTTFTAFGVDKRSLKLAYCANDCQGQDAWNVRTLKIVTNPLSNDLTAVTLAQDTASPRLYVGYQVQKSALEYHVMNAGIIRQVH